MPAFLLHLSSDDSCRQQVPVILTTLHDTGSSPYQLRLKTSDEILQKGGLVKARSIIWPTIGSSQPL
ncbi:hypothetical protein VTN02DRAFT_186 [Thermoascus thermophilus]